MSSPTEGFLLTSSPHFSRRISTRKIMYIVLATLLPAVIISVLYFGPRVLLMYLTAVAAAAGTEAVVKIIRKQDWRSIYDGSAVLTAVLLVMTLPPGMPLIQLALGAAVAIFIGKEVFGGLGANIFNPALVGRAFLSAAYPVSLTTFAAPARLFGALSSAPDAVSASTPLAAAKFDHVVTSTLSLFLGQTGGSLGETASFLLVAGGLVLIALRIIRWELVVSYLGTVALLGGLFWLIDPAAYPGPLFHLFSGGLMLGAFYMATDPVTTPLTPRGHLIYGLGAGVLVVVIRLFGGFPEGVMYSILLMNAVTPIINRYAVTRPFGFRKANEGGAA